jgi:hypothetical protein
MLGKVLPTAGIRREERGKQLLCKVSILSIGPAF